MFTQFNGVDIYKYRQLKQLYKDIFNNTNYNKLFKEQAKWIIITKDNSDVIAFLTYGYYDKENCYILYNVAVNPKYRAQGYSKILITHFMTLINKDIRTYLFVNKFNNIARHLYESFNFVPSNDFIPPHNEICYLLKASEIGQPPPDDPPLDV